MPAQSLAPVTVASTQPQTLGTLPASPPALTVVPQTGGYYHTIESGESLYTIARRYDVTAQAIVQANNLGSPDKIYVGQRILIPGRSDLAAKPSAPTPAPVQVASTQPTVPAASATPAAVAPVTTTPTPAPVTAAPAPTTTVAAIEPVMSGADKFRWPASGKVIVDFGASKQTGINIEVPEGTAVRAAENGQVIYVGSGVEGYGNLVLIRHPNGYVSAYAHLKSISVQKGATVSRGDSIGLSGMTGSVSRPQLHFELRKGATPVDPIPLLAG